jgi:hypothetical protein
MIMTILLRVSLLSELGETDLDGFFAERNAMLLKVADEFRQFEPVFSDSAILFHGLSPAERRLVEERCRALDARFDFQPKAVYPPAEIAKAAFVPLLIAGDEIDRDEKRQSLNVYSEAICSACGACDLTSVPNPFVVRRPDPSVDLAMAANGVRILSARFWQQVQPMLGPWVRTGDVAFDDSRDRVSHEFVWIMPTNMTGSYINAANRTTCDICGRPAEIRMEQPTDPLMWTLDVVTTFGGTDAPVSLAGNWYGAFRTAKSPRLHWPILISGRLHEHLLQLNPIGFVPADRVVETSAELRKLGIRLTGKTKGDGSWDSP